MKVLGVVAIQRMGQLVTFSWTISLTSHAPAITPRKMASVCRAMAVWSQGTAGDVGVLTPVVVPGTSARAILESGAKTVANASVAVRFIFGGAALRISVPARAANGIRGTPRAGLAAQRWATSLAATRRSASPSMSEEVGASFFRTDAHAGCVCCATPGSAGRKAATRRGALKLQIWVSTGGAMASGQRTVIVPFANSTMGTTAVATRTGASRPMRHRM